VNPLKEAACARAREGAYIVPLWWTDADGVCACPQQPCASPGKHPLTPHGLKDASNDPAQIEAWWQRWPRANIGERTDEVIRIDIDLPDVAEALSQDVPLQAETELVRTPKRSGLHIALRTTAPVAGKTLKLTDGRTLGELKAAGGYVLVSPSAIAGKQYTVISAPGVRPMEVDDPIVWLRSVLPPFGFDLADPAQNVERDYVRLGGTIHEGDGRHTALVSMAGRVWIEGFSEETFVQVLRSINEGQCDPPLPDSELHDIADHFIRNRRPTAVRGSEPVALPRGGNVDDWLDGDDPPLDVVIGDGADGAILPIDGKGFVAGSTGIGKTNLLLRLARCLAEGSPFLGLPVPEPRRVLYLALEGSRRGLRKRLRKIWKDADADSRGRCYVTQMQINLASEADAAMLDALLTERRPQVLIIDPLRNAHTLDENSSQDVAQLTAVLDDIIVRHGCALIAAHHDRKRPPLTKRDSGTDRIRGSTALAGWLSFCLSIEKDTKRPDTLIAEWTKVRDAEDALPDLDLQFDRENIDFAAVERTPASKVSDDDILTPVFHAGADGVRGKELVAAVRAASGAGERTIKDRLRQLVKDDVLVEFIAEDDRRSKAKSYRLPEEDLYARA